MSQDDMDNTAELQRNLKHQYRNIRRYVRANPEKGLAVTFISGIAVGILLSRILK